MNQSMPSVSRRRFGGTLAVRNLLGGLLLAAAATMLLAPNPNAVGQDSLISEGEAVAQPAAEKVGEKAGDEQEDEVKEPEYTPKTKAELKRMLTSIQFKVTQNEETEPAFRNKYWDNKKEGIYRCIVCGQSLFSSQTKYKSGTGWPSFYDPIRPDHVGYKTDFHLFYPRKEVHCSRCNAHLGHVFNDGPKDKTGRRYCMNSASMKFESADEAESTGQSKSE